MRRDGREPGEQGRVGVQAFPPRLPGHDVEGDVLQVQRFPTHGRVGVEGGQQDGQHLGDRGGDTHPVELMRLGSKTQWGLL